MSIKPKSTKVWAVYSYIHDDVWPVIAGIYCSIEDAKLRRADLNETDKNHKAYIKWEYLYNEY